MKYYLIAGEKSGDLHASNLMKAILHHDPAAEFRYYGGDEMQKVDGTLVQHYSEMAFMGFVEVALNLRKIMGFMKACKKDILEFKPDLVILVDYAGFNLRMARFAHSNGLSTCYYIAPKVWAWAQSRALKIKANVDLLLSILPFETGFFAKFDCNAEYVGNPVCDAIAQFKPKETFSWDKPVIALLPGSRKQEVRHMLPTMCLMAKQFPSFQFVVAGVSELPKTFYEPAESAGIPIVYDASYELLSIAHSALVTSGTATLETALFNVPQVVCYKTSPVSYAIAKRLIRVPYISLVNLINEKETVKELIQDAFNEKDLAAELALVVGGKRDLILEDYQLLKSKIDTGEPVSSKAASAIATFLSKKVF